MDKHFEGCYTALVTPMDNKANLSYDSLKSLVEFQMEEGVSGMLATGTTGESPTLSWDEHISVIQSVCDTVRGRCYLIAGTGSNNTEEAIEATKKGVDIGVDAILLVDPYYNGPSSLEIRREYIEPIARRFTEVQVIPYIIPGRTGTQLQPQDLKILHNKLPNVNAVKEATGDLNNAIIIRKLCGNDFSILSGDDDKTFDMMARSEIEASGVISVASNIAPQAVQSMVKTIIKGELDKAQSFAEKLKPLFEVVTVKTVEDTPFGEVPCKARNPLPYKTMMRILGIPVGPCRPPLGMMTQKGVKKILDKTREIYEKSPEVLDPIEDFFDVNLQERLYNQRYWRDLTYDSY